MRMFRILRFVKEELSIPQAILASCQIHLEVYLLRCAQLWLCRQTAFYVSSKQPDKNQSRSQLKSLHYAWIKNDRFADVRHSLLTVTRWAIPGTRNGTVVFELVKVRFVIKVELVVHVSQNSTCKGSRIILVAADECSTVKRLTIIHKNIHCTVVGAQESWFRPNQLALNSLFPTPPFPRL